MKKIIVGCCGFPCNKKEYFRKLSAVEIQSTFYELPSLDTAKRWREEAPADFEFTLKAWQLITHETSSPTYRKLRTAIPEKKKDSYGFFKPTDEVFEAWEKTSEIAKTLKAKIILFQCPSSFKPSRQHIKNIKNFFKKIKGHGFIYAWEPRGSWQSGLVRNICTDLGLIHCVDPFFMNPQSTLPIHYFRLHGMPLYNLRYSYSAEDLKRLIDFCNGENYVFFNNLNMLDDALNFYRLIKA